MNIFSETSVLGRFLNWAADIVFLNILWLICSVPIVTIGASTTALYYSLMKRQRRDEGYVHTNFFHSFKENFKQSTIIWLILIVIGLIIGLDLRIGMYSTLPIGKVMIFTSALLLIPYVLILLYVFPVLAKFENNIATTMKNSLLMSVAHFGYTLLILLFLSLFILFGYFSTAFLGVIFLCGPSLFVYLASNVFIMVFRKYLPDELEDDLKAKYGDDSHNFF